MPTTSTMPQVRVTRPLPGVFSVPGAEVRFGPERGYPEREAFVEFARGASAIVTWVNDRIDGPVLDAIGHDLKIVANFAVGYDNIDLKACRERNIRVSNTPDAVTEGTADVAVMLMLAAARRLSAADRFVRSGAWQRHGILGPYEWIGLPLAGRTLLIVGAGRIGYATALRCLGWGMKVLYSARHPKPAFEHAPLNGERVEIDEGLRRADFVSLHVPLSPETRHIIDARRLALMKPTAVLVNTGRGPLIDEAALVDALKHQRLFGAGLDVLEHEPHLHPGLAELENVVLTPHYGSASETSRASMSALCAANIREVLAGREPVTAVV
ncbi:MAG: 2-hydroxyacid dehydrogenase [Phycisphaerales bacterium]